MCARVKADAWVQRKFCDFYGVKSGYAFKLSDYVDDGVAIVNGESIQAGEIKETNLNYLPESFRDEYTEFCVSADDIVLGLNRPIISGELKIAKIPQKLDNSLLYQRAGKVEYKNEMDTDFSYTFLSKEIYRHTIKEAVGSDQPFISTSKLSNWAFIIPTSSVEQTAIGNFFRTLDTTITLHKRKLDGLKVLKSAYLQQMFPRSRENVPRIRFTGFSGDWETKILKEISNKVTEKNSDKEFTETLTNSAEYGIINQREFFDKNISNEKNLGGYYVVRPDDFVYNPRISNHAPVGPIKRNLLGRTGVMSPLYYVFRVAAGNLTFIEKYFESVYWHEFMKLNGDNGVRADRFNIKDSVFEEMPIPFPSLSEQKAIGELFHNLDNQIIAHQIKLDNLKQLKSVYLHKMFV